MKYCLVLLIILSVNGNAISQSKEKYLTSSFYLIGSKGGKPILTATGFFIRIKSQIYIITNNHVVGGKFANDEYLRLHKRPCPKDSIPDAILLRMYGDLYNSFQWSSVPLLDKKGNEKWIKFYEDEKDTTTLMDIVAIPISEVGNPNFKNHTIFDSSDVNHNLDLYITQELFVVGYPLGWGQYMMYPLWKRGTIASYPNLIYLGISSFWIDATTRFGMSGSPVVFRGSSVVEQNGVMQSYNIPLTYLVGIYSAQDTSSELGAVTRLDKIFIKLLMLNR